MRIFKIKHARNGGEHRIKGLFVDGYDEKTDTIYEFAECLIFKFSFLDIE